MGLIDILRRTFGLGPAAGPERQFGAVPYRDSARGREFLLITSRRTGRWIFPKGGRMAWLSPAATAEQEAYEEAGVEGVITGGPVGRYRSTKVRPEGNAEIEVEMFPLDVEVELEDWPEKGQRRRRWASAADACIMLSEPGLVEIVRSMAGDGGDGA